ncbi:MAG: mechanosensitive ion channel family protein [Salinivirgaceae bacterium]|jgi:small-conductance mechanosensitive channel|nr:mechanosensitive ion channel family protein [Salinivirgaceae bacterium]
MEELFTTDFWTRIYENAIEWAVNDLPGMLILFVVTFLAFRMARFLLSRLKRIILKRTQRLDKNAAEESEKRINTLIGISRGAANISIWIIFFMVFLNKLGLNIAPLLASAGILGLAIGFGAQELVRDFISGFFMLLENQIRAGDVAIINGTAGLVEAIELRTTTLRDFSGVVHIFQNGKINSLSNMTKEWSAIVVEIGVAYKEDADVVMAIMKEVAEELEKDEEFGHKIKEEIEIFGIDKFLDSAVLFKARIKTFPIEQWGVAREYRRRIKRVFDERNIEIPFPHTTVYWGQEVNPLQVDVNKSAAEETSVAK